MRKVGVSNIVSGVDHTTLDIAVASTPVTVYTDSFPLKFGEYFALFYKATATGTPHLKIELEQSWARPTTEGSSDDNYVEAEDAVDIESDLETETQHLKRMNPAVAPYGRLKITGNTSNPADTTLRARLCTYE